MAFSPDGQTIASASADNTVRLWDATYFFALKNANGTVTELFNKIHTRSFEALSYRMDGLNLARTTRHYFTPKNGYEFPKPLPHTYRPRPAGMDPIEWLLQEPE